MFAFRAAVFATALAGFSLRVLAVDGSNDPSNAPALPMEMPANYPLFQTSVPGLSIHAPAGFHSESPHLADMKLLLFREDTSSALSISDKGDVGFTPRQVFRSMAMAQSPNVKVIKTEYLHVGVILAVRMSADVTQQDHVLHLVQTVLPCQHHEYVIGTTSETMNFDDLIHMNEVVAMSVQYPEPPQPLRLGDGSSQFPGLTDEQRAMVRSRPRLRFMRNENTPTGDPLNLPDRAHSPTAAETAADLKAIEASWHTKADSPVELLPKTMQGDFSTGTDGAAMLQNQKTMVSTDLYASPAKFQIVALTNVNDLRLSYPANQIIFNWEMIPTELRIDGGPASGKYLPGAGRLPANTWVGIEMDVTNTELTLYVNGTKVYDIAGDFSKINQPLKIESHTGTTYIRSVRVLK